MKDRQWQVELWQECGSRCAFCYLKEDNRYTPDALKLDSLNKTIAGLDELRKNKDYNAVSYIGGEFFQGQLKNPEVHKKFMELMKKTADLVKDGIIHSVWLAATMTIGDQKDLWEALEYFKDVPRDGNHGMWIITSWDAYGRFHTDKMRETWEHSVQEIHRRYPNFNINTTIILSGSLIDLYMDHGWRFIDFCKKWDTSVFMKQPSPAVNGDELAVGDFLKCKAEFQKRVPNFFVTRKRFLDFLTKVCMEEPEIYNKMFNIQYRADTLMRNYNDIEHHMVLNTRLKDNKLEFDPTTVAVKANKCGHPMDYTPYIDTNDCCLCDRIAVWESIMG